jgi:hypothetical protein
MVRRFLFALILWFAALPALAADAIVFGTD